MSADNESASDDDVDMGNEDEPFDNYDDLTVDEVIDAVQDRDADDLRDVLGYEQATKDRVGVTRELESMLESDDDSDDASEDSDDDASDDDGTEGKFTDATNCPTCGTEMDQGYDDDGEPRATCDDCDLELDAAQLIEDGSFTLAADLDEDTDDDSSTGTRAPSKTLADILAAPNNEWHNDRDLLFSRKQAQAVMYAIEHPDASLSAFDEDPDLPSSQYARDVLYRADPDAGAEDAAQLALARFDAEDDLEDLADDADDDDREKRERAVDELKQVTKELRDAHNTNRHTTADDDEDDDA